MNKSEDKKTLRRLRRIEKSLPKEADLNGSENFLNISETISLLEKDGFEVTQQQIRKYEAMKLIIPAKKKKDKYRFYSPGNIDQLRTILSLRVINLSLKKIKRYFELIHRLKDFVDRYMYFRKEHMPKDKEIRVLGLFTNEVIRETQLLYHNPQLMDFDEEKFRLNNSIDAREALFGILHDVQELTDLVQECLGRWHSLKNISEQFGDLFEKKEQNLVIVRKKIEAATAHI